MSPAVLLAAELFSEAHPVEHSAIRGFLVHMVLGLLLGYLFVFLPPVLYGGSLTFSQLTGWPSWIVLVGIALLTGFHAGHARHNRLHNRTAQQQDTGRGRGDHGERAVFTQWQGF